MLCFDADRPITRAEAAVILCRLLDVEEPDSSPTFADKDSIPVWARASVSALYELGIYTAEDGHTEATATLTRADAAQMLYRTLKLSE